MLLFSLVLPAASQAREVWASYYHNPWGGIGDSSLPVIVADPSGSVYIAAWASGPRGDAEFVTLKYDALGKQVWERRYNSGFDDGWGARGSQAASLLLDAQGNVLVAGPSYGGLGFDFDIATVKYDPDGNQLWVARWDSGHGAGESGGLVGFDAQGNIYLCGGTTFHSSAVALKYSPEGKLIWANYGAIYAGGRAGALDKEGNLYVTGGNWNHLGTAKYSSNGDLLWTAIYDYWQDGPDAAYDIAIDPEGNACIVGEHVLKYSPDGQLLWAHLHPEGGDFKNMAVDGQGNIIGAGGAGGHGTVAKYDPAGNLLWVRKLYPLVELILRYSADLQDVAVDTAGNVYITGYVQGRFFTAKLSPDGRPLWGQLHDHGPREGGRAWAIGLSPSGDIYVTGQSVDRNRDVKFLTIKYSQYGPAAPLKK